MGREGMGFSSFRVLEMMQHLVLSENTRWQISLQMGL